VLSIVSGFFEQNGAAFAVIGAFGLHAYGRSRATQDIDFVTQARVQPKLIASLENLGYETLYRSQGYSYHLHDDPSMGRVDFVYVEGETGRKLFERKGTTLRLWKISVPVPQAEHLVAMKVQAMKNDPERTLQEMADIGFLLTLPGIDQEAVREYFEKAGLVVVYEEIRKQRG
jgi:hypothetical protein